MAAWEHYKQYLPQEVRAETFNELMRWAISVDEPGNLPLLLLYAYRSLMSTLVLVETAVIAAAEVEAAKQPV